MHAVNQRGIFGNDILLLYCTISCCPQYLPFEHAAEHFKNFGKDHEATLDFLRLEAFGVK
jgi:hypothetical protein